MPRAPRGKRVDDSSTGSFMVVNRAPRGQPDPFFDRSPQRLGRAVAKGRRQNGTTDRPDASQRTTSPGRCAHLGCRRSNDEHSPRLKWRGWSACAASAMSLRWLCASFKAGVSARRSGWLGKTLTLTLELFVCDAAPRTPTASAWCSAHRRPVAPPAGNYSLQRRSRCWRRTMTAGSDCAERGSCPGPKCRIRVRCLTSSS